MADYLSGKFIISNNIEGFLEATCELHISGICLQESSIYMEYAPPPCCVLQAYQYLKAKVSVSNLCKWGKMAPPTKTW